MHSPKLWFKRYWATTKPLFLSTQMYGQVFCNSIAYLPIPVNEPAFRDPFLSCLPFEGEGH